MEFDWERRQEQRRRIEELAECEDMLFGEVQTSDLRQPPVLGFNSGKYDLNTVKEFLFPYLIEHQNSNYKCLKTKHLELLDISNYVAPGFSYDAFLPI